MARWFWLVLLALWPGGLAAEAYRTNGQCDGFPAVMLQTPPGLCVGLVADHLGFVRGVAAAGDAIYLVDMGGWRRGRGRLLRLDHGGHDAPKVLLTGLDEPNALAMTPDGTLYAGLLGRIVRVVLSGPAPVLQDVLTGLPSTGRHPLPALAAAADGSLYVNVGSATDHCEDPAGKPPNPSVPCPERAAAPPRASIVRFMPGPAPLSWAEAEPVAFGLRNSMALAALPGGALLAAVNARDWINRADPALPDADLPHDTFHVVASGGDYGWPYCFDMQRPSPEYPGHDCSAVAKPALLLPPHAAPLGLLLYRGEALPGLDGRLVLPYHGYRARGHRVMSLAVGDDGQPLGEPAPLIQGWDGVKGRTPQGAPVAVAEAPDGSVLITEDHNGTLLRLSRR